MKETKLEQFQGLRAIAFLAIFISHVGIPRTGALGAWGVSIFFLLSGFIMTYSYWNRELSTKGFSLKFAISKISKLYCLHIITMLGCVLIELYNIAIGKQTIIKLLLDILLHSTLTQIWIPYSKYYSTLNGVAWYLCVSLFLYAIFPILLYRIKRITSNKKAVLRLFILFILQICISIFAYFFCSSNKNDLFSAQWITYYCPLSRMIDFMMGGLIGYLYINKDKKIIDTPKHIYLFEIMLLVIIPVIWLIYATNFSILGSESVKYTLLYSATTGVFIWILANYRGIIYFVLSNKLLIKLGNVSSYTFLIHNVTIKYCKKILSFFNLYNVLLVIFLSIITTVFATWLWILIVKRCNRHKE